MQNPQIEKLLNEAADLAEADGNKALYAILNSVIGATMMGDEKELQKYTHEFSVKAIEQIKNVQAQKN